MNRLLAVKAGTVLRTSGWTLASGTLALAIIVLLVCYWQTVRSLVWVWAHDGTYQYAVLIFPLSMWAVFSLRHTLLANPPKPSVWGLAAVALLAFVWYTGNLLSINLPQHFALVAMFPALVLACWGWRATWVLVFPLGYLVFAVPWGDALVGPLQDITAHFAVRALELTGTPVLLNGREIVTPSAVWMVADACSGVKFFIACTALGCLYAWLMYRRGWKRVLFVVLAAIVPVIANGLRVYFTVLIGDTWGLNYATGTDHMIFGWQFFGTVLLLLLLAGWFFRDHLALRKHAAGNGNRLSSARAVVWPLTIVLLVIGPAAAARLAVPTGLTEKFDMAAPVVADWRGPQPGGSVWRPVFKGAMGKVQAAYQSAANGQAVELFHAVYAGKPSRGHNLITYGNNIYDPTQARLLSSTGQRVGFADKRSLAINELQLADAGGSRVVWYWYCVDRRCTSSAVLVKLLQTWYVLRGQAPRSAVWGLSASVTNGNLDQTRASLRAFARVLPLATDSDQPPRERHNSGRGEL